MSGEYYCIEEVGESSNYLEGLGAKTNRSDKVDDGDHDNCSNSTKKNEDCHLSEIEEELQKAECRCNKLKSQLDFMKKNYQTTTPRDLIQSRNKVGTPNKNKHQRKRSGIPSTPYLQNSFYEGPLVSKSPSSPAVDIEVSKPKSLPFRQNSNSISTDNSGAAVKTINNILNRINMSQEKDDDVQYAYVEQPFSNNLAAISGKPFSPRLKKRMYEQQKKVEELARETHFVALNDIDIQTSSANIKSKETSQVEKWTKQITGRVKSGLKKATSKINAKNAQSSYKKRRGFVKRLMSTSKISEPINDSNVQLRKFGANYSTDNLIELYHNVAAKFSDSDVSNHVNKLDSKQGAGDVYANATFTSYVSDDKALAPIDENIAVKNSLYNRNYLQHLSRNYESPTIASKLKRVTKNYLRSFNYFNFRCIPFCAAKSTSPSHNIGINIQQVMSIIKSKQPIGGISPTLAHNIQLAAEKLQGGPLSTFVSNLNTRIGSIHSTCPLVKHPLNFTKLQELAKTIPEEPLEEEEDQDHILPTEVCSNIIIETATKNSELPPMVPTIWSAAAGASRCTCTSQKIVPFQKVLNKYKVATFEMDPLPVKQKPKIQTNPRQIHTTNYKNSKQKTADWISKNVKENISHTCNIPEQFKPSHEPHQQNELRGREKSLKAVLNNLHDEFDNLNMKYEELSKSSTKSNPHTMKLLDDMEQQLNKKEDEINMVMSLYTEVLALKDQVKKMKERSSLETIPGEMKESIPASHLTHLLHKIQNYQNRLSNK